MQPHAFTICSLTEKSPVPENVKLLKTGFDPSLLTKIWAFTFPLTSPDVVSCRNKTRLSAAFGNPFEEPFKTYQAPPVKSFITISWPEFALPKAKAPTHGWDSLSTVLISCSAPAGLLSIPMVTQLSPAKSGKKPNRSGLIETAVVPPNWLL